MFTTVVDNAVARYTLPNGTEVAFAYDESPFNPVEEYEYRIGIQRDERDTIMTDPTGVLTEYYELTNRIEDNRDSLDYARKYLGDELIDQALNGELDYYEHESFDDALVASLDELREDEEELKGITFLEWQDTDEYGWPTYHVAYRAEEFADAGWNTEKLDSIVKGMAREYSAWANGSVYLMGIEVPGDEVEYVSCYAGFDPHDEEQVRDLIADYVGNADGLQAA